MNTLLLIILASLAIGSLACLRNNTPPSKPGGEFIPPSAKQLADQDRFR